MGTKKALANEDSPPRLGTAQLQHPSVQAPDARLTFLEVTEKCRRREVVGGARKDGWDNTLRERKPWRRVPTI
jgi:hypothetical protein